MNTLQWYAQVIGWEKAWQTMSTGIHATIAWWQYAVGWGSTCELIAITASALGIAICTWQLGTQKTRRRQRRTNHWHNQQILR